MVSIEMARQGKQKSYNLRTFNRVMRLFKRWCRACPHNFTDKRYLLEAERASVSGQNEKALEKYLCAIAMAKANNFVHIAGVANERLGFHCLHLGQKKKAIEYWHEAQDCFRKWKARALVNRLEQVIRQHS